MFFVTRKMGPTLAVSNDTIASWLRKPLPWTTSGPREGQPEKAAAPMLPSREPQLG